MGVPIWAIVVIGILTVLGVVLLLTGGGGPAGTPCPKCKRMMMPDWVQCMFCGTHPLIFNGQPGKMHFVTGPFAGKALILDKQVTTIGSAAGNDVVLTDTGVSRKHVGIRRLDGGAGYELADLGAKNGVTINGEKKPKKLLAVGDIVRVGSSEMLFRV